jgi:hypothetical protein
MMLKDICQTQCGDCQGNGGSACIQNGAANPCCGLHPAGMELNDFALGDVQESSIGGNPNCTAGVDDWWWFSECYDIRHNWQVTGQNVNIRSCEFDWYNFRYINYLDKVAAVCQGNISPIKAPE